MPILFLLIIVLAIAFQIIGPILRGVVMYKAATELNNWYNATVEQQLRELAWAIQHQQQQQIAVQRQSAIEQIRELPREHQAPYKKRLSAVMSKQMRLNTSTGEWEG